ncbi:MAG TPA: DUF4349 domain-containing protein [Thermoleophilia bacterium]|nr:DUF4349 domain-containing protein [Thermoleophilia bacterium]
MSRLFHRHRRLLIVGGAVVVLLVGAAAAAGLVSRGSGSSGGSSAGSGMVAALPATIGSDASNGATRMAPASSDAGAAPASSGAGTAHTTPASSSDIASDLAPLQAGRFLVRTGEMTVIVSKGAVPRAAARVVALTSGYGGYVLTSQVSSSQGASQPYAEITVRVPAGVYDAAIQQFGSLGRVQSVQTSATDVTSRAVDLNARLTQAQRVDRRLTGFLARATTVSEALAVQTRIDATELRVEELRGELKALRQQVTYGTLTVSISERAPHTVAHHRNSFLAALSSSWRHLAAGFAAIVVGFGVILPFVILLAVLALIAWYGARVATRLHSRPRLER